MGYYDPRAYGGTSTSAGGSVTPASVIAALPTRANAYPFDIYVANRVDGLPGTGTQFDPIHIGNVTAFDIFMGTTLPTIYPTGGAHVHFAAGTYTTWGGPQSYSTVPHGFNLAGGNWYEGAGMWQTTIQANALSDSGQMCIFQTLNSVDNKNTRVSGFSFDTRWPSLKGGSPPITSVQNWIEIDGSTGIEVDHCGFINGYGNFLHGEEHFGCKISGWVNSGTDTPVLYSSIHDCYFSAFQGDYGGPAIIWSIPNNLSTTMFQASCSIYNNFFDGINHLQLSGATSGVVYCIGAPIGQGCEIYGNNSWNCDKFYYNEGGTRNLQIHDNMILNCLSIGGAINLNPLSTSLFDNIDIFNNHIEVSTIVTGLSTVNNQRYGINAGFSSSVAKNIRIRGNTITRKQVGYTTATRSHSGTTATVSFLVAPGFNASDVVDTTLFGDSRYNVGYAALTKTDTTHYTFQTPLNSFTESGPVTDTTGTLTLSCSGLAIATSSSGPMEVSGNLVDSTLYNQAASSNPAFLNWHDNLTWTGAPITLNPAITHDLPSIVHWEPSNDPVTNGSNLVSALAHAVLIYPNAIAPSATNRVTLNIYQGIYTFTAGPTVGSNVLLWGNNFIDLIGIGNPENIILTSSGDTLTLASTLTDAKFKNFNLTTTSVTDGGSVAALWPLGTVGSAIHFDGVIFSGAGTNNGISGTNVAYQCTFTNCTFTNAIKVGQLDGTFDNCRFLATSLYGPWYVPDGTIINSRFFGPLQFSKMGGLFEKNDVVSTVSNTDAISITDSASSSIGSFFLNKIVANGTGKSINATNSQTIQHSHNIYSSDVGANILNGISTPYNVVSANVTQ